MFFERGRKQQGVTLLELMLALAIAMSLLFFGFKLIFEYRFRLHESELAANVDQLLQAMSHYYQANCRQTLDSNFNPQTSGALDPRVRTYGSNIFLDIQNDLIVPGFLAANWPHPNVLVASGSPYQAIFVPVLVNYVPPTMSIYACSGTGNPPACTNSGGTPLVATSNSPVLRSGVYRYLLNVVVALASGVNPTQVANDLNVRASYGPFILWERTANFISQNTTSDLWASLPYVKQFNRQYTNDGMAMLSGVNESSSWYHKQDYLCGE